MNKRRLFKLIVLLMFMVLSNCVVMFCIPTVSPSNITVDVTMEADKDVEMQMFYSDGIFDADHCQTISYVNPGEKITLKFSIPTDYTSWRIDFGREKSDIKLYSIKLNYKGTYDITNQLYEEDNQIKYIENIEKKDGYTYIQTKNGDPQCIFSFDENYIKEAVDSLAKPVCHLYSIIACIGIDLVAILLMIKSNMILELVKDVKKNRKLMFKLAKNDFKTKYVGSYLGLIWAFVQPTVTILVYWFVFGVGLRSGNVGDVPFVLWLISGLVPWFFFSDSLSAGTSAMMEYQYLVKKVVFDIDILPLVKIISAMFVHLFFMALTVAIYAGYKYYPDFYTLQIVYYSLCTFVLAAAVVYFTCSLVVFFRDTTQFVMIFLQVGVWMTPIMWQVSIIPERLVWIFKAMPLYYIVSGYRDALIDKNWFWDKPYDGIYFWCVTILMFIIGTTVFKKLKVHFADVL